MVIPESATTFPFDRSRYRFTGSATVLPCYRIRYPLILGCDAAEGRRFCRRGLPRDVQPGVRQAHEPSPRGGESPAGAPLGPGHRCGREGCWLIGRSFGKCLAVVRHTARGGRLERAAETATRGTLIPSIHPSATVLPDPSIRYRFTGVATVQSELLRAEQGAHGRA